MSEEEGEQKPLKDTSSQTTEKPVDGTDYHYSPVPSDCMACANREKSRRYKELLEKKEEILCEPLEDDSEVCFASDVVSRKRREKLHVVTTNKRFKVFGKWDKNKLVDLLTDRLVQRITALPPKPYEKVPLARVQPVTEGVPYDPVIHRGIYSEKVLQILHSKGASEQQVIRAMKFGLRHLEPEELVYFESFGVTEDALHARKLWSRLLDNDLFVNLRAIGLQEIESQKVVIYGMLGLEEFHLMQLTLAGVDVPGIFNWKGPTIATGTRMIEFLRKLGAREDLLQLVVQRGIDEETKEMLKDLGYTETEEEHPGKFEVVTCECSLTILESGSSRFTCDSKGTSVAHDLSRASSDFYGTSRVCATSKSRSAETPSSTAISIPSMFKQPICVCHMHPKEAEETDSEIAARRNDYLRQSVMVPLAWAMGKALRYRPSDPKHYIAHQLLRWKSGTVCQEEMKAAQEFIVAATIKKDAELVARRLKEEEEMIARINEEALKQIPCLPCSTRRQLHRIKKGCWKCVRKWVPRYEPCEFPDVCSSCRVDLSDILQSETPSSTPETSTDSIGLVCPEPESEVQVDEEESFIWKVPSYGYREGEGEYRPRFDIYSAIDQAVNQDYKKHPEEICCPFPCDLPAPPFFMKQLDLLGSLKSKPSVKSVVKQAERPPVSQSVLFKLPSSPIDPKNLGKMRCKEFHDCGTGVHGVVQTCREPEAEYLLEAKGEDEEDFETESD